MEINCSYCEKCDTLWDDKEIENGLCFDCQEPVIKMVARPIVTSQQSVQRIALRRVLAWAIWGIVTALSILFIVNGVR